ALLRREVGRARAVHAREVALGAPAAEDRLAPPGRRVLRARRHREIVAVAADPRVRIGKTGPEDDRRGAELPVDMRVALVVEHEVEGAVVRTVRELHEAELLDRCDEPEP